MLVCDNIIIIIIIMLLLLLLSRAFSSRYYSWTTGDPHRSSSSFITLQSFPYKVLCFHLQLPL
jgi:hypothetical protein